MTTYLEVARSLPVPTPEQTRAFARHVTDAHSWYKHLPAGDGVPFVFFLDPNSGRTKLVGRDGIAFQDRTGGVRPGSTTESYRRHFGHWNYEPLYNEMPKVLGADGRLVELPTHLVQAATTRLNMLMFGQERRPVAERDLDVGDEMRFACIFASPPSPGSKHALSRAMGLEATLPALPASVAGALRSLVALWGTEAYQRELSDIGRDLAQVYAKVYARKGTFDDNMTELGGDRIYAETKAAWERSESRCREKELLRGVLMALDVERERQVAGMVKAMVGFLAALVNS